MALALERDAVLRINCEAVMWKITTRGFTLEEVLIMAAMNLLTSADSAAKREKRAFEDSNAAQPPGCTPQQARAGLSESAAGWRRRSLKLLAVVAAACTSVLMASRNLAAAAPRRQRRAPVRAQLFPVCPHRKASRSE